MGTWVWTARDSIQVFLFLFVFLLTSQALLLLPTAYKVFIYLHLSSFYCLPSSAPVRVYSLFPSLNVSYHVILCFLVVFFLFLRATTRQISQSIQRYVSVVPVRFHLSIVFLTTVSNVILTYTVFVHILHRASHNSIWRYSLWIKLVFLLTVQTISSSSKSSSIGRRVTLCM